MDDVFSEVKRPPPTINEVDEALIVLMRYWEDIKYLVRESAKRGIDVEPELLIDLRYALSRFNIQRIREIHKKLEKQIVL